MKTYILSSYAALQTPTHEDIDTIIAAVHSVGGTSTKLPQTVIASLDSKQYAKFTMMDTAMANDANILVLHSCYYSTPSSNMT